MSDLRVILLVLGCLFIVGIYCREVFFKSDPKRKDNILDAIDDIPDLPSMGVNQADEPLDYSRSLVDLGNMIAQSRSYEEDTDGPSLSRPRVSVTDEEDSEYEPTPVIKRSNYYDEDEDTEATAILADSKINQDASEQQHTDEFSDVDFDLFSKHKTEAESVIDEPDGTEAELVKDETGQEVEAVANDSTFEKDAAELTVAEAEALAEERDRQLGQSGDDLVVLYVTSPAQTMFNGLLISKAADEVGMIYGHMNVFHHFGPGKLHSGQPLFSMANMFEPGSFDLGRMADLRTKGVVLFMYSPASIEPGVVFELFLNTTQRVAKLLNGEIRTEDNQILTTSGIKSLRLKAEHLSETD